MKRVIQIPVIASLLGAVLVVSAGAAELLDVKPVGTGTATAIEVSADIPMTYTYYKIPGQARAVVDIADADPEKVEPLIVVNKGAVSSISVDKAMLGDMTVSRLVFNLVAETDIAVQQSADKKVLMVTFGDGKQAAVEPVPAAPVVKPAPVEPPAAKPAPAEPAPVIAAKAPAAEAPKQTTKEEEDPLGLDEPQPAPTPAAKPTPAAAAKPAQTAAVIAPAKPAKLEPVVPAAAVASPVVVRGIVVGASYIDIQTSAPVEKFKQLKLSKPERLVIEVAGTSKVKVQTIQVKRFGISKVRVGSTPGVVRLVLDATAKSFPAYEASATENGVRISFK